MQPHLRVELICNRKISLIKSINSSHYYNRGCSLIMEEENMATSTVEAPSSPFWTVKPDEEIEIKVGSTEGDPPPVTIVDTLASVVSQNGERPALKVKRGGEWKEWSYKEYYTDIQRIAKSCIALGLEPHHGVSIIGFNSPEWAITFMGAIMAGGISTGVYTTNSKEACQHIANNSRSQIIVCENKAQVIKYLQIKDNLPHLKKIVKYLPETEEPLETEMREAGVINWEEFMEAGKDITDDQLSARVSNMRPGHCASLIYTSGTTGPPKGVMLSHDNIIFVGKVMSRNFNGSPEDRGVSFLPLSHVAGQMSDLIGPIVSGGCLYFAQPDALKGSLRGTLLEVCPTAVIAVPRLWEKFKEAIDAQFKNVSGFKKFIIETSMGVGRRNQENKIKGNSGSVFGYGLANRFVFKNLRSKLGLDDCRICIAGAAPLPKAVSDFYAGFDIALLQVYGMSETASVGTINTPDRYKPASVGRALDGVEVKIHEPDPDSGDGEICFRGRNVFMGYLDNETKTREAIDDEGWLHSGDIGRVDEDGFYYITGRKKEIIITKGGENIAPVPIEDCMKEEIPIASNVMLVGDDKKYLTMLVTLRVKVDENLSPTDELSDLALNILCEHNSQSTTVTEAREDDIVKQLIQEGMDRANGKAISRAARVQKFTILAGEFSIDGGEMTSTMKLKRSFAADKYKNEIDAMYTETP